MIHLERTSLVSEGGDASQFSYQVHVIDSEDKLSQLIALEQQLELTEKRFRTLQNYVEYIRTLYHGSLQDPSSLQVCNLSSSWSPYGNVVQLSNEHQSSLHSDDGKDGSGDVIYVKDNKDESTKKKKNTKKKNQARKIKSPSRRNFQEEPSQRLIEKKAKLKADKSTAQLRSPKKELSISRSYLNPTVSSQMKRIKPCHPSFNFRSIPFVAGKATSRSHNLGIKIQETLSIIKRNTPAEVGRCTDVVPTGEQQPVVPCYVTNPISRSGEGQDATPSRSRCSVLSRRNGTKSSTTLSDTCLMDDISDTCETHSYLRKALLYIQADFTETLNEYKKLTSENDPNNDAMIKNLEEKLDRKEEVIIAFSRLYNQVIKLRHQLESHYPGGYCSQRACSRKSKLTTSYPAVKLTRLLRKIQDFQNKLQGYPI